MRPLRALLFSFGPLVLSALPALCQTTCDVTCEPNPQSPTYTGGTIQARPQSRNLRGQGSVLAPTVAAGGGEATITVGSESYNYAIPILSLPGRNGLDLNLALFYSSRVWTVDSANSRVTFNADRDFPSYGFRLGFGYIEQRTDTSNFVLTEPDGSKRTLTLVSGTLYQTKDSSFADFR